MKENCRGESAEDTITMKRKLEAAFALLRRRRDFLENVAKTNAKLLKRAPEGTLRISKVNGRSQYYLRTDPTNKCGVYIPNKDRKLVYQLAQKSAAGKTLRAAEKEWRYLTGFLEKYPACAESVYEKLSAERKNWCSHWRSPMKSMSVTGWRRTSSRIRSRRRMTAC